VSGAANPQPNNKGGKRNFVSKIGLFCSRMLCRGLRFTPPAFVGAPARLIVARAAGKVSVWDRAQYRAEARWLKRTDAAAAGIDYVGPKLGRESHLHRSSRFLFRVERAKPKALHETVARRLKALVAWTAPAIGVEVAHRGGTNRDVSLAGLRRRRGQYGEIRWRAPGGGDALRGYLFGRTWLWGAAGRLRRVPQRPVHSTLHRRAHRRAPVGWWAVENRQALLRCGKRKPGRECWRFSR